jgi:hypothetical protein
VGLVFLHLCPKRATCIFVSCAQSGNELEETYTRCVCICVCVGVCVNFSHAMRTCLSLVLLRICKPSSNSKYDLSPPAQHMFWRSNQFKICLVCGMRNSLRLSLLHACLFHSCVSHLSALHHAIASRVSVTGGSVSKSKALASIFASHFRHFSVPLARAFACV